MDYCKSKLNKPVLTSVSMRLCSESLDDRLFTANSKIRMGGWQAIRKKQNEI